MGGLERAPHAPRARRAPAKPGRPSMPRELRGLERAPHAPRGVPRDSGRFSILRQVPLGLDNRRGMTKMGQRESSTGPEPWI